jgi:hypothetical protein
VEDEQVPCRVVVGDYLSVARRVTDLTGDSSKAVREFAENLICKGL